MVSSTLERPRGWPRTTTRHFLLKWQIFLMTATFVISSLDGAVVSEKLVSSSLDANWAHTSLLAETSEFLAAENSDGKLFWQFIDKLAWEEKTGEEAEQRQQQEVKSHAREFEHALATAARLLADGQFGIQLLRFALSLRIYSPRVQLHRQIASDLLPQLATQKCKKASPFYEIHGEVSCILDEAEQLLSSAEKRESSSPVYSVDHVFASPPLLDNGLLPPLPLVVLYVDVGRPEHFRQFHKAFAALASQGRIRYVLRHFDGATQAQMPPPPAVSLSGYGVELAIKSTEYKAIDDSNVNSGGGEEEQAPQNLHGFNFRALREKHVHLRDQLQQFQLHLAELDELAPLKQWEIADIGMQAAQRVMDAPPEEAIPLLMDLAQNFPTRARTLVQTKVRQSFREEIELNQQRWAQDLELGEGESGLWLNGIPVDVDTLDPFQLFRTLRQEHRLADAFARLGFKREYQSVLQAMDLAEDKATGWALDFREAAPEWLNNLDKDKQYGEWGNSVRLLLQPYFPGMIRPIARNLFTLLCILDPAAPESRTLLKTAFSLFSHQVPLRIGFILAVNDSAEATGLNDLGVALYNVFQFVKMDKGVPKAVHFLQRLYDELSDALDLAGVHRFFKKHNSDQEVEDVFGPGSDYDQGRPEGIRFFRRSGLQRLPSLLVNGVPLDQQGLESPDRIEESILVAIMRQTSALQRAVIAGRLTDRENVQNWVLSQPDALPRLNPRLLGGGGGEEGKKQQQMHNSKAVPPIYADVPCSDSAAGEGNSKANLALDGMSPEQRTQCVLSSQRYLVRADEPESAAGDQPEPRWLTIWLVADLATASGRQLAQNALKALKKSNQMRLALVHNGGKDKNADNVKEVSLPLVADALLARLPSTAAKQSLNKLLLNAAADEHQWPMPLDEVGRLLDQIGGHGVGMEPVEAELRATKGRRRLAMQSAFVARELGLAPGQRAVLLNGQIYGPLEEGEQFEPEDFALMEKLAEKWGAKAVAALVNVWQKEGGRKIENPSDLVFKMLSAVNAFAARKPRKSVDFALEFESVLNLLADESEPQRPTVELTAIVDPLSRSAQKLAPILQTLMKVLNADLRLAMNPRLRLSELPLKRFYRYVLRDQPAFSPTGQLLPNSVHFRGLPQKQLLTLNPIVPDAWMVQPVWANHDLDNIRVATASKDIVARFQLRHILLEGHCFDEQTGNPPRGLQFVLGTRTEPAMFDTIVMANLGYFQLKAGPGAWILRLREGRSKEIYELKGSVDVEQQIGGRKPATEGEKEAAELEELHVLVDSFSGKTIRLRVNKRKGMEKRNLLATEDGDNKDEAEEQAEDQGSIWSNLAPNKVVKKLSSKLLGGEKHEVINIFSLASGHLYERFLRIMMLSVLKNTKHPVKFWLLNNYLSPQFRESLPTLAQHYGFDYQLIEYKWPRWLHQQTEKQRVMWGYKILFLDVLFPLDVKKIIFVDADQVVRTDMMELMEYDLEGAPYGYTPFCHSRTSMDGFRFWKSGYWASHLAGRRYHISALYVVDLVKFRQIAAGDRLRGQYQGLSADPNSLSNLDQDLPNNMIHQVRIHSLPQEWLWCETWCDDVSKAKAKTIDLCNNPQTKEPKLDSAVRIIPEWTELDNEIKQVLLLLDGTTRANVEEEETGKVDEEDANHQQQHEDL